MNEDQQPQQVQQSQSQMESEPNASPGSQTPVTPSPGNRPKSRKVLIVSVIMVVALILCVTVAWLLLGKNQSSQTTQQASPTGHADKEEVLSAKAPEDIISKVYDDLATDYTVLDMAKNNNPKAGEASVQKVVSTSQYQVKGYGYSSNYDGGVSLSIFVGPINQATDKAPRDVDIKLRKQIANTYTQFGLTKIDAIDDGLIVTNVYTSKDIICFVAEPDTDALNVGASCGEISKYEAAAKAAQPFAVLLKIDDDANNVVFAPKIVDSSVDGYQRAEVSNGRINGGGGVALFYKKDGGEWIYFKSTQQLIGCTEYNSVDLHNAFKGEPCYDSKGATTNVE
ncbi:MAG: hypothetical protein WBP12_00530 [Candidatus Saccharimonas sp.]